MLYLNFFHVVRYYCHRWGRGCKIFFSLKYARVCVLDEGLKIKSTTLPLECCVHVFTTVCCDVLNFLAALSSDCHRGGTEKGIYVAYCVCEKISLWVESRIAEILHAYKSYGRMSIDDHGKPYLTHSASNCPPFAQELAIERRPVQVLQHFRFCGPSRDFSRFFVVLGNF